MNLIKLTDSKGQTQNSTQWGEGQTHSLPSTPDPQLCSRDVLHAYRSLNLALLLNPIHANISDPQIWEAIGTPMVEDWDKVGCFSLTTTKRLPLPEWYTDLEKRRQVQIRFAILCAEEVLPIFESKFPEDRRPREAIEAAKACLKDPTDADANVAYAAAYAASRAAANVAYAAAYAASRAANVAYAAAYAANVAYVAADAAYAASRAADAAYAAARAAGVKIDFNELADKTVEDYLC